MTDPSDSDEKVKYEVDWISSPKVNGDRDNSYKNKIYNNRNYKRLKKSTNFWYTECNVIDNLLSNNTDQDEINEIIDMYPEKSELDDDSTELKIINNIDNIKYKDNININNIDNIKDNININNKEYNINNIKYKENIKDNIDNIKYKENININNINNIDNINNIKDNDNITNSLVVDDSLSSNIFFSEESSEIKDLVNNNYIIDLNINNKIYYNLNVININKEENIIYTSDYKIINSNNNKDNIKDIINLLQSYNNIRLNIIDNIIIIVDDIVSVSSITAGIVCKYGSILYDKVEERENIHLLIGILLHRMYKSNNILEEIRKIKDNGIINIKDSNEDKSIIKIKEYNNNINIKDINVIYNVDIVSILLSFVKNIIKCKKLSNIDDKYEVNVNSRILGLKGIVDIYNDKEIVEIKTGKKRIEHQAQLLLYHLIDNINNRIENKTNNNKILRMIYLKDGSSYTLKNIEEEAYSLIKIRNEIAYINNILKTDNISINNNHIRTNNNNLRRDNKDINNIILVPKHNCSNIYCNTLNKLYLLSSLRDKFLYRLWIGINIEDTGRESMVVNINYSRDNIIIVDEDVEYKYLDVYINSIKVSRGRVVDDRNINKKGTVIEIESNINNYISSKDDRILLVDKDKERFCKIMRYSLLNIAVNCKYLSDEYIKRYFQRRNIEYINDDSIELSPVEENEISLESFESETMTDAYNDNISLNYKERIPNAYLKEFEELNFEQQYSLLGCLDGEYSLVYGYPGTGKTKVLVLLVHILVEMNLRVLIVCHTRRNIKNIIDRLSVDYYYKNEYNNIKEEDVYNRKLLTDFKVVISTCYSFRDHLFNRKFDYLIVDEASQQHLLMTLIPVSISSRFVLIGDDKQLGVLSTRSEDLAVSLFEFLGEKDFNRNDGMRKIDSIYNNSINSINDTKYSKTNKQNYFKKPLILKKQYRMGRQLMVIANNLFYDNMMECMIDYDGGCYFVEYKNFIMKKYKNYNFLCFTNKQVDEINATLSTFYDENENIAERVSTIDRYQGSECDRIILMFHPICELMKSKERINVAVTRAKKEMIIVGVKEEMERIEILKNMLKIIEKL